MDDRQNKRWAFQHVVETWWRVQALCNRRREPGRRTERHALPAWPVYRLLLRATSVRSPDADIRIPMIFSFAGLGFLLLAIERDPSVAAAISASFWLASP